jgi:two-component system, chemotaxis family, sensor kinase CheA
MSDLAETLWREFAVETEEHFEIVEPLLVAAEGGSVTDGDIAQLFRSFHSVKGLSRSMDMRGMEACAHHAENLLGLVRDGTCPLDSDVVSILLEAIDALKELRHIAVTERRNDQPPAELIAALEEAHAKRAAGVGAAPAKAAEAQAVATPAEAASESPPLGPDPDMLRIYAEMVQQHLPAIARAATSDVLDPAVRGEAVSAIDSLLHATEVMGFEGLAGSLNALRTLLDGEVSAAVKGRAVEILGQIRSEIELIEREAPAEIVGPALADRLRAALQVELHALVDAVLDVLCRFSDGKGGGVEADDVLAAEVVSLVRNGCTFFLFLHLHQAARLALMVEDIFMRVANGEMYLYPELLTLTRDSVGLINDVTEELGSWRDLDEAKVDKSLDSFRQALLQGARDVDGTDPVSALKRVLNDYDISSELVEILSAENIQDLISAVRGGRSNLYEIMAHLEGSEELTLNFVKWVRSEATPITNRTVFVDGKTWFEFLVVSSLDKAAIDTRIAEIDPSGASVRVRPCPVRGAAAAESGAVVARGPDRRAANERRGGERGGAASGASSSNVLRVRGETIDNLMAQVGEMVTISNMLHIQAQASDTETAVMRLKDFLRSVPGGIEAAGLLETIETSLLAARNADEQLNSAVGRLQDATLELRVVPIDTLFNRFPRLVRDLAQAKGKQVRLEAEGAEVRIDKGMVDMLIDPLMHMVRNGVDHGIETPEERRAAGKQETARISLKALSRGNRVVIEIRDDGRGIDVARVRDKAVSRGLVTAADASRLSDREVVNFIFSPGFSTADQVSETSGRGVGMDVVHTNVMRLGGTIEVETSLGVGSTFTLQLPLSAAIQRVLMVEAGGRTLAIPERFLAEIHEAGAEDYQLVRGRPAILLREAFLPIFRVSDLLGFPASASTHSNGRRPIVVLVNGRNRIGLEVDRLDRRQELFVKEIHPNLASIPGVGGASISGDGKVVLIVDGEDLFSLAEHSPVPRSSAVH